MKTIFETKAAPESANAPEREEAPTIANIVEIFASILHQVYKYEPNTLTYTLESGPDGYLFHFHSSEASDADNPPIAAFSDGGFYRSMCALLQDLRDFEQNIVIVPTKLAVGTSSLLRLVDTLDLYFRQRNGTITTADNATINLPTAHPAKVSKALRHMAKEGRALALESQDAYDYYFNAAAREPFVSLDHYYASIAARAQADIPLSLELLRKDVLALEGADAPMGTRDINASLEDSFKNCAQWSKDVPSAPQKEHTFLLLKEEAHWQLARAILQMMIVDYGLAQEILTGKIGPFLTTPPKKQSLMRFVCPTMPDEKTFGRYLSAFGEFEKNLRKAGACSEGVDILPVRGNTLLLIRHAPEKLFSVVLNMAAELHPGNMAAQTHLRSFFHINERIELGVSPPALS